MKPCPVIEKNKDSRGSFPTVCMRCPNRREESRPQVDWEKVADAYRQWYLAEYTPPQVIPGPMVCLNKIKELVEAQLAKAEEGGE